MQRIQLAIGTLSLLLLLILTLMMSTNDQEGEPESGQTVTSHGIATPRRHGEDRDSWFDRHQEAIDEFKERGLDDDDDDQGEDDD